MSNIYKERLLKLADHLEWGKLGHDEFTIIRYSDFNFCRPCGTTGCAIGECPFLFPDKWEFSGCAPILIGGDKSLNPIIFAMEFFGATKQEASHLFVEDAQETIRYGGQRLFENATKEEVAANIREFVKRKYKNETN